MAWKLVVVLVGSAVDARDRARHRAVAPVHVFECIRNLPDRCAFARGIDRECQQVAGAVFRGFGEFSKRGATCILIAARAHLLEAPDLRLTYRRVVDVPNFDRCLIGSTILVHADDDFFAAIDARLADGRRFLDAQLGHAGLDRLGHAAHVLDFVDEFACFGGEIGREFLHVVGTGERIDDVGDAGFFLQHELRIAGDAGREVRRQRKRFVEGIGVQRLRATERGGHGLRRDAHDVVVGAVGCEAHARRLAVRAQHQRLRFFGANFSAMSVDQSRRAARSLATSMKKFMPMAKKNERRGANLSTSSPRVDGRADVFDAVGDRVGQLLGAGRPGFLHVIAGDRDRVVARHVAGGEADDVGDDAHRRLGRIDVGVADHELFEDVVLQRAGELVGRDALLFGGDDVHGHDGQRGAVHGHGDGHLVERDAVEEDLHVLDRIDGDAGLADVADNARVIGVIAAVGGQVERDGEARLAASRLRR